MTGRDSIRDLERDLEDLETDPEEATVGDLLLVGLKSGSDVELTDAEQRLYEHPERYLSAEDQRAIASWWDTIPPERRRAIRGTAAEGES